MRTFELRVYKLRTKEALDFYMEQIYPRHLSSFPLFGIEAHGFWTAKEDVEPRLFVLASYAAGEEPINRRVAIKAALAYSTARGGTTALAAVLYSSTGEQDAIPNQRRTTMDEPISHYPPLAADDLSRNLTLAQINEDASLPHIGLVGDTYTITVTGAETAGRFCVLDMHIPPGGGPPPHRHDFEETFILLEGEMEATFRGKKTIVKAGDTINIPANAPHRIHNISSNATRLLCICSPAGLDEFFKEVGTPVATRTTLPPKLDEAQQAAFIKKVMAVAPKYRTEILKEA